MPRDFRRPPVRQTRTYVVLEVSPEAYAEIRGKLEAAGYQHAFEVQVEDGHAFERIDMHGIALQAEDEDEDEDEEGEET